MVLAEAVVDRRQDAHHQVVGNQLALINVALGCLAQLGAVLDLVAQHVARGDVLEAVLLNQFVTLGALAGAWGTENHDIPHFC